jgi:hypothetical protein
MAGLAAAIHTLLARVGKSWMSGARPGMTDEDHAAFSATIM